MGNLDLLSLLIPLSTLSLVKSSNPTKDNQFNTENTEYGNYFEGDIILNAEQAKILHSSSSRNGLIDTQYRWPNKTVVYEMSNNHTREQQLYIKIAHWVIESVSCIKFVQRTNEDAYIQYQGNRGCSSYVGYQNAQQPLDLAPNTLGKRCFGLGTIVHEHFHALGFFHMQSAYDRDDYVHIKWQNIIAGYEHNFMKYNSSVGSHFNGTYDYDSVMHYYAYQFSKTKQPTIVPLDEKYLPLIGQRTHLSDLDIRKLNDMYECGAVKRDADDLAKKVFEWETQMNHHFSDT